MKTIFRIMLAAILLSVLLAHGSTPAAQAGQPADENLAPDQSLETLLNPDGTLNLATGFSGSLDATGWQMSTGPGGEPRFTQAAAPSRPAADGDEFWDPRFMLGADDSVYAIAVSGTDVYIGGDFSQVGDVTASNVAKWDSATHQWSALGSGVNSRVMAIAAQGDDVYVGGNFTMAGEISAPYIAHWNDATQTWSAMGSPMTLITISPEAAAIAVAANGDVYVGGQFETIGGVSARNIARWDGSAWHALGSGVYDSSDPEITSEVCAIAINGSDVYVGGIFLYAGGAGVHNIAHWNGSAWLGLGSGTGGIYPIVTAIAVNGSSVYIGGEFDTVTGDGGPISVGHVAMWNGAAWDAMGGGVGDPDVSALAIGPDGIYVGGRFSTLADGSTSAKRLARWDGSTWYELGGNNMIAPNDGVDSNVYALAVMGNTVYVGGFMINSNDGMALNHIGYWDIDKDDWYALGNSVNADVYAIAIHGNDVYLGGRFNSAGGVQVSRIARWNQSSGEWSDVGGGVSGCTGGTVFTPCKPTVYAIEVDGDRIYVGGNFTNAGGAGANGIALWDVAAETWQALGYGVRCPDPYCPAFVRAIDMAEGYLYVGGTFEYAGESLDPANNIAMWDGVNWAGMSGGTNGAVYNIQAYTSAGVWVGGDFTSPGNHLVLWGGAGWGADGNLNALVRASANFTDLNRLHIGGEFIDASGNPASDYIASMYSGDWQPLGAGFDAAVYAMSSRDTKLYAAGAFTVSGIQGLSHVAIWDENALAWSGLGGGTDDTVYAITTNDQGKVYVGGIFLNAGGKPSAFFGRWGAEHVYLPLAVR